METKFLLRIITATVLVILGVSLVPKQVSTQQNTTVSVGTNFTKLFTENKEFQSCYLNSCVPAVDVVYQGPIMLVFKSSFIDTIWKAVELAKKEGYKIDGISTYTTTAAALGGGISETVNTLVAMSKG